MNKDIPKLYRRRFIPDEKIFLKDDIIVKADENTVITKWKVLSPVHPFTHGISCYFIKEGFKVSKFMDDDGRLVYWYCDIIETDIDREENSYTFNDLLVDVIIYPDGSVQVVDIGEIAEAMENNILSDSLVIKAMQRTDKLLGIIYGGGFGEYQKIIEMIDK